MKTSSPGEKQATARAQAPNAKLTDWILPSGDPTKESDVLPMRQMW